MIFPTATACEMVIGAQAVFGQRPFAITTNSAIAAASPTHPRTMTTFRSRRARRRS